MPFDWDQPLNGVGCKLSPFGLYDTVEGCRDESHCNARWRCAARGGENDVFGARVDEGNPLLAADGVYNTREECKCYECDPSGGGCVPTDKTNGTHQEASCGDSCVYGYKANPANNNTCELSLDEDAVGVSEEECQIVQFGLHPGENAHGGGYGCFNQFACRYGVCVGIPESGHGSARTGETVYESMTACTDAGCDADTPTVPESCDPFGGNWRIRRDAGQGNQSLRIHPGDLFTFSETDTDADGFTWYESSLQFDGIGPVIRIALKEELVGGERQVYMKFRLNASFNSTEYTGSMRQLWSSSPDERGSWESPHASEVAVLPNDDSCFTMYAVNLNEFCAEGSCVVRIRSYDDGNPVYGNVNIILQREEDCGEGMYEGVGGDGGAFDASFCSDTIS